ncbi:nucleotide exchange factor GrpE [Paenibacillus cymbidii]|uniref:nucleotide exchange factor GrpE n=1 Tax=Paenibacillus cymbidii TaxID=1639034 RepID=UPI001080D0D9|nr:nucleotide exchange factor GrpE [Paenibacillus cymbidii]
MWNMWRKRQNEQKSAELEAVERLERQWDERLGAFGEMMAEQLGKLSRVQYKSGQETLAKMDRLGGGIDALANRLTERDEERARLDNLIREKEAGMQELIRLLDDFDLARTRLQGTEMDAWSNVIRQWSDRVLALLAGMEVRELHVLGRSFDPSVAEAVATTTREERRVAGKADELDRTGDTVPYEVVAVERRGFVTGDGRLLRKAQVITISEG